MDRRDFLHLITVSALSAAIGDLANPGLAAGFAQATPNAGFAPDIELELTMSPDQVPLLPGEPTHVWRFTGRVLKGPAATLETLPSSYLGPVIRLRRGQKVRIRFANRIPEDSIIHWHGLDVPELADGHPRLAIASGADYVYDFEVTNRAGTYWYHPHPHMRTGAQVYQGLAGILIVQDAEEDALGLPSGSAEQLCVLQDRVFDTQNQLVYVPAGRRGNMAMMTGFLGERMLINGRPQPTSEVDASWRRVRLLNASNARIYKLAWTRGLPMVIIGGDGGLLERAVRQQILTLAPGQRADVLLDLTGLSAGTEVSLESRAYPEVDANMGGMNAMMRGNSKVPNGAPLRLMTLRTRDRNGPAFRLPERLSTFDESWVVRPSKTRRVPLSFQRMEWLLGGRTFGDMNEVAAEETVAAGSTQVWEFANLSNRMGMQAAHPIHMHGRQFRVLSRSGANSNSLRSGIIDAGWTDTVLVLPGETVRVQVTFTKHPGLYLYHCHILEHEDMGMMRNFRVV